MTDSSFDFDLIVIGAGYGGFDGFFELSLWLLVEKILNPTFDNSDKVLSKEFNISSSIPSNLKNGR